jgi:hypothetical protein
MRSLTEALRVNPGRAELIQYHTPCPAFIAHLYTPQPKILSMSLVCHSHVNREITA